MNLKDVNKKALSGANWLKNVPSDAESEIYKRPKKMKMSFIDFCKRCIKYELMDYKICEACTNEPDLYYEPENQKTKAKSSNNYWLARAGK